MDKTIREANFRATQASRKFKEKLHELDQFGPLRSSLPANLTVMNKHRRLDPISFKDNLAAEHHRLLETYDSLASLDNSFLTQGQQTPERGTRNATVGAVAYINRSFDMGSTFTG